MKVLLHYSGQIAAVVKSWMCTIFIELFLTANVIGYDMSNAVHWPPDGATNMPYKCFVNPANIAIITTGLSEHSAQMYDAWLVPSSGFTALAAETQCWCCWSRFETVPHWLSLVIHRLVVLSQSLEGKEEVGGQTMTVGWREIQTERVLSFIIWDV